MTLASGTRLGPYEILSPIGAGGMGEVYRARDARLGRDVAVKVLPTHLTADPDLKARFEREARAISQLTHPHICTLYDVGNEGGVEYLVMELLEGQTLADRLARGPLPLDQTFRFGAEIADALDRAHRAGIVHRDLKPGNVMLTKSGVKLLDFGLAKTARTTAAPAELSALPTETAPPPLTARGTVMGTIPYMSPEQLEGKEADARSDIFAFGCVLYEMATGRRAFTGASQASLVSSILRDDPEPVSSITLATPPALDRVVKTCLAKDPEDRWQSARDVMSELRWIAEAGPQAEAPAAAAPRRRRRGRIAWGIAAAAILAVAGWMASGLLRRARPAPMVRFEVTPPPAGRFGYGLALSPDGSQLVFEGAGAGVAMLYLRRLSSTEVRELPGTEGATFPFWSPDGTRLGFFAHGSLQSYDLSTGATRMLALAANGRGGSWSRDGLILFAPDTGSALFRVSSEGGAAVPETELDARAAEGTHRWPVFLPDGRHYLFLVRAGGSVKSGIYAGTLGSKKKMLVVESASMPAYSAPGYLLYVRQKSLVAQRFDAASRKVAGRPVTIATDVPTLGETQPNGYARFAVSAGGVLAVRSGVANVSQFTWFDREGKRLSSVGSTGEQDEPALSPDGRYVVFERNDPAVGQNDLWKLDLAREIETRLTFERGTETTGTWSRDGKTLVYASGANAGLLNEIDRIGAAGAGDKEALLRIDSKEVFPDAISPDGKFLLYEDQSPGASLELMVLPLEPRGKPTVFLATPFHEAHGQFSPDGRWVSYTSNESGREEVYVRPFPSGDEKWQVSADGGDQAFWKADGTEIYYLSQQQKIVAVPVDRRGPGISFGAPHALFPVRVPTWNVTLSRSGYVPAHDGTRFLVNEVAEGAQRSPILVTTNWTAELAD